MQAIDYIGNHKVINYYLSNKFFSKSLFFLLIKSKFVYAKYFLPAFDQKSLLKVFIQFISTLKKVLKYLTN